MEENNNYENLNTNTEPVVNTAPPIEEPVQPTNNETVKTVSYSTTTINIPEEYKPISMWGYFGYQLLFAIPCIGFIFLLVYAFGSGNVNRKNFARSYFCFLIIGLIIGVIAFIILSVLGIGFSTLYKY